MPDDNKSQSSSDVAKSYIALNTLRDYLYQQKPKHLLATDFVEDIPSLRPFGSAFSNILPSAAIISNDPQKRKLQIAEAVKKVNQASKKEHPVASEALSSAAKFGLGSIPLSLAFGLAEKSVHVPGLKNLVRGERPRFTFKENFSNPEKRKEMSKYLMDSSKAGVAQGAIFGATPVILSNSGSFNKHHLDNAAKVLNEHPNLAALPGADLSALNNVNKSKHEDPTVAHIKNTLAGGLAAGTGALAVQGLHSGSRALHNITEPYVNRFHNNLNKKLKELMLPSGKPNQDLHGTGLKGSGSTERFNYRTSPEGKEYRRINMNVRKNLRTHFPIKSPSFFSKKEILEPLTWKSMRKPVLGLTALGVGLSGLGSYLSHPAHKNV